MIYQSVNIATAPANASVTTANAKTHLKVEHSADDTYIDGLIQAAEKEVETYTNRVMISTVFDLYLSAFPPDGIVLPFSPVSAITSIKYYDSSNVEQTWASTNYHYNIYEEPTVIRYLSGTPSVYTDRSAPVVVRFTAGYPKAAEIPAPLIQAIKLLIGGMYEYRTDTTENFGVSIRFTTAQKIMYPCRVFHEPEENQ